MLSYRQRDLFHSGFAKIFRGDHSRVDNGFWKLDFAGHAFRLPLRHERMWLDWDAAVSIVGHDSEVKKTYERMIRSPGAPNLFVDVGGNFGTHSLLFLICGISAITFEPNDSCHGYFREVCELNGVAPRLEGVALGDRETTVVLSYPQGETWLGSVDRETTRKLSADHSLVSQEVTQRTLDDYLGEMIGQQVLLKIDTEGNELQVLRGASQVLERVRPKVIFESWRDAERRAVFELFASHGYAIRPLPTEPIDPPLSAAVFESHPVTNFMADGLDQDSPWPVPRRFQSIALNRPGISGDSVP